MLTIREATDADAALIRRLISELAEYVKESDQVRTTEVTSRATASARILSFAP
jgi:hypothetical protein